MFTNYFALEGIDMVASSIESFVAGLRTKRKIVYLRGDTADEFLNSFRKLPICMVRRRTAREKFGGRKSASMYPAFLWRVVSPGHDEIRRVPVLRNASAM